MLRGLVLGKFMPYHAGHAHLIRTARASVDELTVLVCSIAREPIDGVLRHHWDLYAQYSGKWSRLRSLVAATRKSKVNGGRW